MSQMNACSGATDRQPRCRNSSGQRYSTCLELSANHTYLEARAFDEFTPGSCPYLESAGQLSGSCPPEGLTVLSK
eukprot:scaffold120995_cov22-Prasinocladus_malaysianus.AAC.1